MITEQTSGNPEGGWGMVTRAELKSRAKTCLRHYYWWAFLACLLAGLLGGGSQSGFQSGINFSSGVGNRAARESTGTVLSEPVAAEQTGALLGILAIFGVIIVVAWIIGIAWATFVGNPVRVGCSRYFMESREQMKSAGIGRLFYAFEGGKYGNVVKTMFLRNLFISLWTALFVIPGIIKSYQYMLVPYILQDDPQMDYRDALNLSKDMMDGYKWNFFVLSWSFVGWELLGLLCCGVGVIFVTPYMEATYAEFYAERRKEKWVAVETRRPDDGFGDMNSSYYENQQY